MQHSSRKPTSSPSSPQAACPSSCRRSPWLPAWLKCSSAGSTAWLYRAAGTSTRLYGQEAHAKTDAPRPERDAWEQALIQESIRQDVPLLCICRGEQLLNVTLGGSLHQHLPDVTGNSQYQPGGYNFNRIPVEIKAGSRLEQLIGANPGPVPVSHHQAVDKLGDGLVAAAWGEDQVVEAIEYPAGTFTVGIQWHPEELPEDLGLFRGFVEAARGKFLSRLLPAAPSPVSAEINASLVGPPLG